MQVRPTQVVYFVPELPVLSSGVLHAQVLTPAHVLARHGFDVLFVGTERSANVAEAVRTVRDQYEIEATVLDGYSSQHGYVSLRRTAARAARLAGKILHKRPGGNLYVRSFVGAAAGRRLAQQLHMRLVYDVRAPRAEEVAMAHGHGLRYYLTRRAEVPQIRRADRLACVSHGLRAWIRQHTGRDDALVIPCCIDPESFGFDQENRDRIRGQYHWSDQHTVLCYCGGLSVWQRIDDVLRLFGEVAALEPHYRFLFITPSGGQLTSMLGPSGLPMDRCAVVSCPHRQVPHYLAAADAGVIMRANVTVNQVSSPVKIAEYLACGLPVVLTEGIGDLTDFIRREGVGMVLDESRAPGRQVVDFLARSHRQDLREKTIRVCHEHLSFDAHLEQYRALFEEPAP